MGVNRLSGAHVYEVLLGLPFASALEMFHKAQDTEGIPPPPLSEMTVRVALLLVHLHSRRLGADTAYVSLLLGLRERLRALIRSERERVGVNAAALRWISQDIAAEKTATDEILSAEPSKGVGNLGLPSMAEDA